MQKPTAVFDVEIYKDYLLVMFRNVVNGKTVHYELYDGHIPDWQAMRTLMQKYRLVSFNGIGFDMPLIMMALSGEPVARIKEACNAIIEEKLKYWSDEFKERFPTANYYRNEFDHIDLIEVAPGTASLKIYGGRLHAKRMQDLPIEPDASIGPEDRESLRTYCANDLQTTIDLLVSLKPQIELREKMSEHYGVDLRSKSDAQIAEQVIRGRVQRDMKIEVKRPDIKPGTAFKYQRPHLIGFETKKLNDVLAVVLDAQFEIDHKGDVVMPGVLADLLIEIGRSKYQMGIGGLHSTEKCAAHVSDDENVLIDRDVVSYYPAIILNQGLYPKQMGPHFLRVYRDIVDKRIAAKKSGDKAAANSLKIVVNGSYGKLGSKWSTFYAPELLIQTTITGQLCLLMLIESLEVNGIPVVSANTDGVVIKCPRTRIRVMKTLIHLWETDTGFETEETFYKALYSRDVNNYIALKIEGGVKTKGALALAGLMKNPTNEVCVDAISAFLEKDVPIEDTIRGCTDIRKFVTIRKVNGGAIKNDEFLGKAVRWYYAQGETGCIRYKSTGDKVSKSEGGKPLMTLPDTLPNDINYDWYISETESILKDVGWKQ